MKEFVLMAEKQGWKYYYFAGFDTPYRKTLENAVNSVEAYFGIFNVSGKLNTHYDELTIPVTNMTDGAAIPIVKTTAPETTAPAAKSMASSSLSGSLFSVLVLVAALAML